MAERKSSLFKVENPGIVVLREPLGEVMFPSFWIFEQEVEIVGLRRIESSLQRDSPWIADRGRRQSSVQICVVWRLYLKVIKGYVLWMLLTLNLCDYVFHCGTGGKGNVMFQSVIEHRCNKGSFLRQTVFTFHYGCQDDFTVYLFGSQFFPAWTEGIQLCIECVQHG